MSDSLRLHGLQHARPPLSFIVSIFAWNIPLVSLIFLKTSLVIVRSISRVWLFVTHERLDGRPPCPSPFPGIGSNLCPWSQWCYSTIWFSVVSFSSCLQFFPTSWSFPVSQLFASGGQSFGASASVLPVNIQDWFPLELTGLISLQSKGISRVFSNTTVQEHQFFGSQLSLWPNSPIHPWLLENHMFDYTDLCQQSNVSTF